MLTRLRNHFGTAGLVVAIVALIAALAGGAFAATGGGATASKAKATRGPKGPKGPKGDPGTPGVNGTNGKDGVNGTNGKDGTNGSSGTSATTTTFVGNEHGCAEGGVEVKSASAPAYICKGVKGTDGQTGFTETLPSTKTETGTWAVAAGSKGIVLAAISFPIPLTTELDAAHVVFMNEGQPAASGCTGGTPAAPKADAGFLCVYTSAFLGGKGAGITILKTGDGQPGAGKTGAAFLIGGTEGAIPDGENGYGSFAVTAP